MAPACCSPATTPPRTGCSAAGPRSCPSTPSRRRPPSSRNSATCSSPGEFTADLMTAESEHSAMTACIMASLTGVRTFTATASQGLLLMHEMLHYAAGARVPIVMINVNRTVGAPWGFWPDQTDSLAQRDTGWIQLYAEHGQEALDTVIQAYRIAEQVLLAGHGDVRSLLRLARSGAGRRPHAGGGGRLPAPLPPRDAPGSRGRPLLGQPGEPGQLLPQPARR